MHQLALHPWQITGIIIIGVGVVVAILTGYAGVILIPVGIGFLIVGKVPGKWNRKFRKSIADRRL